MLCTLKVLIKPREGYIFEPLFLQFTGKPVCLKSPLILPYSLKTKLEDPVPPTILLPPPLRQMPKLTIVPVVPVVPNYPLSPLAAPNGSVVHSNISVPKVNITFPAISFTLSDEATFLNAIGRNPEILLYLFVTYLMALLHEEGRNLPILLSANRWLVTITPPQCPNNLKRKQVSNVRTLQGQSPNLPNPLLHPLRHPVLGKLVG